MASSSEEPEPEPELETHHALAPVREAVNDSPMGRMLVAKGRGSPRPEGEQTAETEVRTAFVALLPIWEAPRSLRCQAPCGALARTRAMAPLSHFHRSVPASASPTPPWFGQPQKVLERLSSAPATHCHRLRLSPPHSSRGRPPTPPAQARKSNVVGRRFVEC